MYTTTPLPQRNADTHRERDQALNWSMNTAYSQAKPFLVFYFIGGSDQ